MIMFIKNLNPILTAWLGLITITGNRLMRKEISTATGVKFIADMEAIVSTANKKGLSALPFNQQVARLDSLIAYGDLRQQVSDFEGYKDKDGNVGGDPKWVVIAFNKMVQKHFGFSVTNEMTEFQARSISNVRRVVSLICELGVKQSLTRKEIRTKMWEAVEMLGNQYKQTQVLMQ
jgi:hypothetical protein